MPMHESERESRGAAALRAIACAAACGALIAASAAGAQSYPVKPVRLIVGFPPGGPVEALARILSPKLAESLGQQLVIDNRPGANGNIGGDLVARSTPDGYTLLLVVSSFATNPHLYTRQPFDPLADFTPVTLLTLAPLVLVSHPSLPVKGVKDLVALAKARPGELNTSVAGAGSGGHLALELMKSMSGANIVAVPHKGGAAAITDAIGGHVQLTINSSLVLLPHIKTGRLRALGVSSAVRMPATPDIPTIAEQGLPGYEASLWYGIVLPAKAPGALVARLNTEFNQAVRLPEVRERLHNEGVIVVGSTADEFGEHLRRESAKWGKVIREAKLKLD